MIFKTSLLKGAFFRCYEITSFHFTNEIIDEEMCKYSGLTHATFDNSVKHIEYKAFYACKLVDLYLPDSITTIGQGAFQYNANLRFVRFPKNLTSIGGDAFAFCDSLTEIILPDNLTELGSGAFASCENVKKLVINKKLTKIPNNAFYCNNQLEVVRIPKNIIYVGKHAFRGVNLKEIIIEKDFGAPDVVPNGFERDWYERVNHPVKITFVNV